MDAAFSEFANALAQNKSRVHVWRFENGVLTETADLGTFFTQSVYLVWKVEYQMGQKPQNTIYIWCGAFSDPEDEGPVNERLQVLYGSLNHLASIHHEYERCECADFYRTFLPYGGVRHRTPGIEYVTNRGFSSLFRMFTEPVAHWREVPASIASLHPASVCFLKMRASFMLWIGYDSSIEARLRAAELCGAFRLAVGRDIETRMVYQGVDDRDFVRSLSAGAIEAPKRAELVPDPDKSRREIYQIVLKGQEIDFTLVATKAEATLAVCQNENAYVLRDPENIYIWFGKQQTREAMGIGLVVAIVFMQKMSVGRNCHVRVVKCTEKISPIWDS